MLLASIKPPLKSSQQEIYTHNTNIQARGRVRTELPTSKRIGKAISMPSENMWQGKPLGFEIQNKILIAKERTST